jgi:predicted O-linked N-acetylglucosamine transferase (SPINDLY family)
MNEAEGLSIVPLLYAQAVGEYRVGRMTAAAALCRQVLAKDAAHAEAWHLAGLILHECGDPSRAIEHIQRAIELSPTASFFANLAKIWQSVGQLANAEQAARRAVDLMPQSAAILTTLGAILCQQVRCEQAAAVLERAVAIEPNNTEALGTLAGAYCDLGMVNESVATYERASKLSHDPVFRILAATRLPIVYESTEDVRRWRQRLENEIDRLLTDGVVQDLSLRAATPLFTLAHQGMNDAEILRKYAKLYRGLGTGDWRLGTGEGGVGRPAPNSSGRIRVGFISSFFRDHTIGKLFRGLIARLSREAFEVTVFSVGQHEDPIARTIAASADKYVPLTRDLAAASRAILENGVDVLVYTDIGMDLTTYSLAFARLASVQCVTWGHPDTSGLPTIDYFVSSELFETPDADAHYTEKLVRLPGLTLYFERAEQPRVMADRRAYGLPSDKRLYGCPQSIFKYHPDFDLALAGILRRDPDGVVVVLHAVYPQVDELLARRWRRVMPDVAERILFLPRQDQLRFNNLLMLCDVLLDPFPYGGGMSSLEAFSFGVPVITLPSHFLSGRFTQAFYRRLGVETCIARDVEDYIQIAVRLAGDAELNRQVREQIVAGQGRLFEVEGAVRDWERFLKSVVAK